MQTIKIEVTDTFGGEANYAWVRRYTMQIRGTEHERTLIPKIKKHIGFDGLRCTVDKHDDQWTITPTGGRAPCQIAFVTFNPEETAP